MVLCWNTGLVTITYMHFRVSLVFLIFTLQLARLESLQFVWEGDPRSVEMKFSAIIVAAILGFICSCAGKARYNPFLVIVRIKKNDNEEGIFKILFQYDINCETSFFPIMQNSFRGY